MTRVKVQFSLYQESIAKKKLFYRIRITAITMQLKLCTAELQTMNFEYINHARNISTKQKCPHNFQANPNLSPSNYFY